MNIEKIIKLKEFSRYWLCVVELLLALPKFEEWIILTRKKNKIDPNKNDKQLEKIIGEKIYCDYNFMLNPIGANSLDFPENPLLDNEEWQTVKRKITLFENKNYPKLKNDINKFRLKYFGKIPRNWNEAINDYLLYNRKRNYPLRKRRGEKPEIIKKKFTSKNIEPYYEIRIYGDSDIKYITPKLLMTLRNDLPTYHKNDDKEYWTIYRRWIYYYLRIRAHLPHKDANILLNEYGFETIEYRFATQELKRFENYFINDKNS